MSKSYFAMLTAFQALLLFVSPAFGQSSDQAGSVESIRYFVPGLSAAEAEKLAADGNIETTYEKQVETRFAPRFSGIDRIQQDLSQIKLVYGIEALYRVPIPESIRTNPDSWKILYNISRSISTLKGIEYYSASRQRMRIFYLKSHAIPNPKSREALPDPLVSSVPENSTVYAFQEDSSFGSYVMQVNYNVGPTPSDPNYLLMSLTNLTTMYYSIIPIIDPKNFRMHLAIVPHGNMLYIYGNSGVDTFTIGFLKDHINKSFTNRLKAISDWYVAQMNAKARELGN
ncbi:DUF6675 family protein [Salinispira pacifica]